MILDIQKYNKFINLLSSLSNKDNFIDIEIKDGKVRSFSRNKIMMLEMNMTNIFPESLNIISLKNKLELFKLFANEKNETVEMNLSETDLEIKDNISKIKIRHPDPSYVSSTYITDELFQSIFAEVKFCECLIPAEILNRFSVVARTFSDDKIYLNINEKDIEFTMRSTSKNETSTIIRVPCESIPSILQYSKAKLYIDSLTHVNYDSDVIIKIYKYNDTAVDSQNNKIFVEILGKVSDENIAVFTRPALLLNENAEDNPDEVITVKEVKLQEKVKAEETKAEKPKKEPKAKTEDIEIKVPVRTDDLKVEKVKAEKPKKEPKVEEKKEEEFVPSFINMDDFNFVGDQTKEVKKETNENVVEEISFETFEIEGI